MLVFAAANLVLFAVPKTGSTAYHLALRGKADIVLAGRAAIKHMTARKYDRHFAPYLAQAHGLTPERVAVIRDPLEQVRSWYRYRQRPDTAGRPNSAAGLSFDEFVLASLQDDPPPYARLGNQLAFVSDRQGTIRIDHLFAYERPVVFRQFLSDRLGFEVKTNQKNVSPPAPTPISPQVEARLRAARTDEFALHDSILAAGGHLVTTLGDSAPDED
ncbi:hypothetical protein ABWH93_15210 [Seohaeicola saemankumensis]|uniref:hypothetical protein n=1 Tax=Seohaeicola TaxID=481178 RepID=UPI0035CED9B0